MTTKITEHLQPIDITNDQKFRDLVFTYYVAMHTSINSVDHLCGVLYREDLSKQHSTGSRDIMRLHRTKCSQLIKRVISTSLLEELIEDLEDVPYSLILDESTDVSTSKYLCACVKYFSKKIECVLTDFLGLIPVESTTAEALFNYVVDYLKKIR